jgi:peptidyl-dipeptidase Dcp
MAGAHTNPTIQALDEQFSAELADLGNDIWLNEALFQRVKQVWQQRDTLPPDSESRRLLEITWQRFTLAGATLADAQNGAAGFEYPGCGFAESVSAAPAGGG